MREPTRPSSVLLLMGLPLVFVLLVGVITLVRGGGTSGGGTPTPTPAAQKTPQATAQALVAFGDCASKQFGAPLAPLDPPANPRHYAAAPPMTIDTGKLYEATVTVANRGTFTVCLEPKLAPQSVNMFVTLARNHYYDGSQVLIVGPDPRDAQIPPLVLGGDPNCNANPSTPCPTDAAGFTIGQEPVRQRYVTGAVAFDTTQSGGAISTFFIVKQDMNSVVQLDAKGTAYNLFGNVAAGMNVVDALQIGDTFTTVTVSEQS